MTTAAAANYISPGTSPIDQDVAIVGSPTDSQHGIQTKNSIKHQEFVWLHYHPLQRRIKAVIDDLEISRDMVQSHLTTRPSTMCFLSLKSLASSTSNFTTGMATVSASQILVAWSSSSRSAWGCIIITLSIEP